MYENDPQKEYQPDWVGGKRIDEVKLAKEYKEAAGLVYADGAFFTVDGRVTNEEGMRKVIYNAIKEYVRSGTTRRVESIMAALRMEAHQDNFDNDPFVIHFKNGTYDLKYYFQDYLDFQEPVSSFCYTMLYQPVLVTNELLVLLIY